MEPMLVVGSITIDFSKLAISEIGNVATVHVRSGIGAKRHMTFKRSNRMRFAETAISDTVASGESEYASTLDPGIGAE